MVKRIIYGLWILLTVSFLSAQEMPYINYTTHSGLPQIQVQKLFQDSKGYIWVGTKGGLAKFNGEEFQHYIFNEYIVAIAETTIGEMYFLTHQHLYKQIRGDIHKINAVEKWSNLQAGENSVWVHQQDKIVEYRKDTVYNVIEKRGSMPNGTWSICYDKIQQHLLLFSRNSDKISVLKDKEIVPLAQLNQSIVEMRTFDDGTVYCIVKLNDTTYSAINPYSQATYFQYKTVGDSIQFTTINELPVKKQALHSMYPAYYQTYQINTATKSAKRMHFPIDEEIYTLLTDKDQNYWAGTDNGLYQFNDKSFKVYSQHFMNDVWTMIKGKDGKYYAGIFKKGLFELNLDKGTRKEIIAYRNKNTIEIDYYYGASKDKKGNLYFPTHYGLVKYDYKRAKQFNTGVCLISTYDAYEDKIVFGTPYGIAFIDANENITTHIDPTQNYVATHPSSLMPKPNGDLFVGSHKGLTIFNKKEKQFVSISELYKPCPEQSIITMATDYKNNIWIGGKSELWLYNSQKDTFEHIGKDFFKTKILSLISPQPNLLLIGTSYEIFAIRLDVFYKEQKIEYKMFNYRNGFFSEEIAQNGFLLDEDKVFIPSATTTSVLDYGAIHFDTDFFNIWITDVNGQGLCCEEQSNKNPIHIAKGEGRIDISFESVGFGLPTQSQFKYKMENVDDEWSEWSEKKNVHYSGLSSGTYIFHVKVRNGSHITGGIEEKTASATLIVSLPFYKEPHFYKYTFFYFLFLTLLASYFLWASYKKSIVVQHRERKIKLLEIATLQAQINPHFIFNFLSSIQNLINKNSPEKANAYLVKFSRLIRSYMESSIKSSKILTGSTMGNENSVKEEIELLETYIELEKLKYDKGKINYSISWGDDTILNKTIPPMILQPFVENAIKHGILPKEGNGNLTVQFRQEAHTLICSITDDGIGRKRAEELSQKSIRAYKSRGLQLIKNRVEMLNKLDYNITIHFEDPLKGGTSVIIKIQN